MSSLFSPSIQSSPGSQEVIYPPKVERHLVFARKWRPKTFDDVIGHDVLLTILKNAFSSKRLGHAFLLTGQRGVGKTTTARLLARAFNCIGPDGSGQETMSPCGTCFSCQEILEERSLDVLEMDAASHTGVEDIREIIEGARYKPVSLRYKVYIIDEVHMLSKSAFNALLKTLEEPPPHVKFIFATTETQKIPVTILSRCQRFDLRRIPIEKLEGLLKNIIEKEGLKATDEALHLLAYAADGSARDGLSLLEQAVNFLSTGNIKETTLTGLPIRSMLGILEGEKVLYIFKAIIEGNSQDLLALTAQYFEQGGDAAFLLRDIQEILYTVLRLKIDNLYEGSFRITQEKEKLLEYAQRLSSGYLHQAWQIVTKGAEEVHSSSLPVYAAEMVLMRLMYVTSFPFLENPKELFSVSSSEPILESVVSQVSAFSEPRIQPVPEVLREEQNDMLSGSVSTTGSKVEEQGKEKFSFSTLEDILNFLLKKKEIKLYTTLYQDAQLIELRDPYLVIWVPQDVAKSQFVSILTKTLSSLTGRKWEIKIGENPGDSSIQEKEKAFDKARLLEASQQPFVQRVLETFPGAHLDRVVEKEKRE